MDESIDNPETHNFLEFETIRNVALLAQLSVEAREETVRLRKENETLRAKIADQGYTIIQRDRDIEGFEEESLINEKHAKELKEVYEKYWNVVHILQDRIGRVKTLKIIDAFKAGLTIDQVKEQLNKEDQSEYKSFSAQNYQLKVALILRLQNEGNEIIRRIVAGENPEKFINSKGFIPSTDIPTTLEDFIDPEEKKEEN